MRRSPSSRHWPSQRRGRAGNEHRLKLAGHRAEGSSAVCCRPQQASPLRRCLAVHHCRNRLPSFVVALSGLGFCAPGSLRRHAGAIAGRLSPMRASYWKPVSGKPETGCGDPESLTRAGCGYWFRVRGLAYAFRNDRPSVREQPFVGLRRSLAGPHGMRYAGGSLVTEILMASWSARGTAACGRR